MITATWNDLALPHIDAEGYLHQISYAFANSPAALQDAIICPKSQLTARAVEIEAGKEIRPAECTKRQFLARSFQNEAANILALLTYSMVGLWAHLRGTNTVRDEFERKTQALAAAHLAAVGISVPKDVMVGRQTLSSTRISAPVKNTSEADVVAKVIEQFNRHLNDRSLLIVRPAPKN